MSDVEAENLYRAAVPPSDVEALRKGLRALRLELPDAVWQDFNARAEVVLARLEQTEELLSDYKRQWEEFCYPEFWDYWSTIGRPCSAGEAVRELFARLEQAERVNRGRYGEVITDLQARAEELQRERDECWEWVNANRGKLEAAERERDEAVLRWYEGEER